MSSSTSSVPIVTDASGESWSLDAYRPAHSAIVYVNKLAMQVAQLQRALGPCSDYFARAHSAVHFVPGVSTGSPASSAPATTPTRPSRTAASRHASSLSPGPQ